ncbi:MAG: mannosyl-glycoproteinendo-beta-N-acetylglucosaminidase [Labilithrix sp.]|nr:mannosyl-glycoproteinendo-beta-N-acetylglucosaminidase [Labilithrix sp.]
MNHVRTRPSSILCIVAFVSAAGISACGPAGEEDDDSVATEQESAAATSWPCYNPQPGHPTATEKASFIGNNIWAAQDAERRYGVPAAALLAMAANEGGYGFTRTSLYANNSFGWKYFGAESAGGRSAYTLACQPSWDVGNQYVAFKSIAEGILFVGRKLGSLPSYSADAKRYVADRRAGVDVVTAVNRFIDGIAEPYNYDPVKYRKTIKRHANDYMNPSDVRSSTTSLYQYSAAIAYSP